MGGFFSATLWSLRVNVIKGTLANRKYIFKVNGMKNKLIVKISCQSLEGVIIQGSDRWDAIHHACTVWFLARSCLKFIMHSSLICLVKLVHIWFSWRYNVMHNLVIMPGNCVPGNKRKFLNEISCSCLVSCNFKILI